MGHALVTQSELTRRKQRDPAVVARMLLLLRRRLYLSFLLVK